MKNDTKATLRVTGKAARLIAGKGGNATIYLAPRPAVNG